MHPKIFKLCSELPRGGPGNEESTIRALRIANDIACNPGLLDAGCGAGASTLVLTRNPDCEITAIDSYDEVIRILNEKIAQRGLESRIKALVHDINDVKSLGIRFDVIRAEGSIYNLGFENIL